VIGHLDDETAVAIGKSGRRNLRTGEIEGTDPMTMYGEPDHCAGQLAYVAGFPHCGDLTFISPVYDDGTVAAYEELIGNHGGLGGLQTQPFIIHPSDMVMPHTSNACDLFPILNARRGNGGTKGTEVDAKAGA